MNRKFAVIILLIFSISLLSIASESNLDQEFANVYFMNYSKDTDNIEIDATIPIIRGIRDEVAQEEFNLEIRNKILDFADGLEKEAEEYRNEISGTDIPFRKYQAVVSCDVKSNESILSFVMSYYQYTGGAHGITQVISHNVDNISGRDLSYLDFKEWFGSDLGIEGIKEIIKEKIKENPDNYFPDALEYIESQETFDYYIEGDSLVVFFQQYDIAPYAAGNPEFRISFGYF